MPTWQWAESRVGKEIIALLQKIGIQLICGRERFEAHDGRKLTLLAIIVLWGRHARQNPRIISKSG